jgi:RNA polymerase sigma factor (sigma-70 family)
MAENASNLERKPDELPHAVDTELLRRYAEDGSEAAFAELVSRHVGLVYAAALRQVGGAAHRAQDVAQTVFVALARQAAPLSRRREIVGWLYTSTHHVAAKLKRTEQRRAQREQEAHAMNEINADDRAAVDWDRLRPVLDAAMHGLSDADREAILLRYFQNLRLAAIGQRLGLSEDAARMRVERALDKLQALLGRHGITSTTAALGVALANPALAVAPAGLAATVTGAALAGVATGTGGAVAAAAILMNTKTTLASVVAVLALGFAVYEFNASRRERDQATAPVRYVVKQLAGNLFNSEAPLQPAQADQLIEIMARNARGPAGKVELVALNVEAAVAQASSLLSPAQIAELRKAVDIAVAQAKLERERNTAPAASLRRQ